MKASNQAEFTISAFSLLLAIILVHGAYVAVIRPQANDFIKHEKELMEADPNHKSESSPYVILRDYEQEACFVLMIWAMAILGFKMRRANGQRRYLETDFIGEVEGNRITTQAAARIAQRIRSQKGLQSLLLPDVLATTLERFHTTKKIEAASTESLNLCAEEAERLESELSMIRYIAWAIPSVGFIGTVRGIGDALSQAHKAREGDITGITTSLGMAFNSTFIALLISIVLMFVVHQVQLTQERLVLKTQRYCKKWVVGRLVV
ncbi:MAG: biopolymer transport protein ExbB/TolQ [Planctomycetota bacterium]|jgi:biopolymer transport protein ExbB/TolQ